MIDMIEVSKDRKDQGKDEPQSGSEEVIDVSSRW